MDATAEGIEHIFGEPGTIDLRIDRLAEQWGEPGYNVPAGEVQRSSRTSGFPLRTSGTQIAVGACGAATPEGSEEGQTLRVRRAEWARRLLLDRRPQRLRRRPHRPTDGCRRTGPKTPGLDAVTGEGFVAQGADIGPGQATFGATGFAPGEEVERDVVLDASLVRDRDRQRRWRRQHHLEVLASDGAGEHRVVFSGPSGPLGPVHLGAA